VTSQLARQIRHLQRSWARLSPEDQQAISVAEALTSYYVEDTFGHFYMAKNLNGRRRYNHWMRWRIRHGLV
jgi:hypothetical protein